MFLEINVSGATAEPPPVRQLIARLAVKIPEHSMEIADGESIEVLAAAVRGTISNQLLWPGDWQATYLWVVRGGSTQLDLRLPMDRERIAFVEKYRDGPIVFDLKVWLRCRVLTKKMPEVYSSPVVPGRSDVAENSSVKWSIDRDQWVSFLKTLGWSEIEIFEIPGGQGIDARELTEAIKELRDAETAFRRRDNPNLVLIHCYAALEAAAKYKGSNNTKLGFDTIVAEAFPGDSKKGNTMNKLIQQVKDFAQLARHKDHPVPRITWAEARFILSTTLGVFEVLTTNPANWEDQPGK
jgi:hypothetical protein